MRAILDGRELKLDRPTLAAALSAGVQAAEAGGRVIVEAWADGRPLSDDEISQPPDIPGSVLELVLSSADPRALVAQTFREAAAALAGARDQHVSAGRCLQRGEFDAAMPLIREVLNTWGSARTALSRGADLLRLDVASLAPPGRRVEAMAGELAARLESLKVAMTRQDWSALADVLAYELPVDAEAWCELLLAAADRAAPEPKR